MLLAGVGHGCLQFLAVLQKAPPVPKVDFTVQALLQGGDTAVQGVLLTPAATNAQGSSQLSLYTVAALFVCVSHQATNAGQPIMRR